jgi:hypothetical protein
VAKLNLQAWLDTEKAVLHGQRQSTRRDGAMRRSLGMKRRAKDMELKILACDRFCKEKDWVTAPTVQLEFVRWNHNGGFG